MNIFIEPNIDLKIKNLDLHIQQAMLGNLPIVPEFSSRDVPVLDLKQHPPKIGFSQAEGQARLLHDLASIELQAMELALRTFGEFPNANSEFRNELLNLTISESKHLKMCLDGIQELGFKWGDWPVHLALWNAVSDKDTLLERVFIVHRYLEGSGLDAADTLLRRLYGVKKNKTTEVVKIITDEEVDHVKFGSYWFHQICRAEQKDSDESFKEVIKKLRGRLPKRVEPINIELRKKSDFTAAEIRELQSLRESFLKPLSVENS